MGDTDERLRVKPIGAPEGEGSAISVKHGPSAGLTLRAAQDCRLDLVALGEVMLRFDPGEGRIVGARSFNVWEGRGASITLRVVSAGRLGCGRGS